MNWVFLSVTPTVGEQILKDLTFRSSQKIISFISTITLSELKKMIKVKCLIVRAIPLPFISLKKVIKPNIKFLKNKGWIVSLIKPQFEIGKDLLGKGGVVKNAEHHQMVVDDIRVFFENEINLSVKGIIDSPILGPKGNKEFLIYGQK